MDAIIHNAIKSGVPVDNLWDRSNRKYTFFLVPVSGRCPEFIERARAIPHNNVFYDYSNGKRYATLKGWAGTNGCTLDDVAYGVTDSWIRLPLLLDCLENRIPSNSQTVTIPTLQLPFNTTEHNNISTSIRDALNVIENQTKRIHHLLAML
jgi:hypothetical protein